MAGRGGIRSQNPINPEPHHEETGNFSPHRTTQIQVSRPMQAGGRDRIAELVQSGVERSGAPLPQID